LTAKLEKDDVNVQMEAISWIRQLGPKAAAARPALVAALKKSQHVLVRQSAAAALGQIGPEAADAVPALTEALRDPELSVRRAAADALGKLGPAAIDATAALENMSKENDACDTAQTALKKIRQ